METINLPLIVQAGNAQDPQAAAEGPAYSYQVEEEGSEPGANEIGA
eukprot:CAMPEP_0184291264 /NCGR_PEP_ID=MMETSP1049-20130417/3333_1 /TAXON_ID=77928 /ORGANISM="Proteomonas sulcata, Strain CCMP704" /LENGTH=45 /DNA_ID= /DNA_START= /DNA_END= /DNA_ORIENTATION=